MNGARIRVLVRKTYWYDLMTDALRFELHIFRMSNTHEDNTIILHTGYYLFSGAICVISGISKYVRMYVRTVGVETGTRYISNVAHGRRF